MSTIDLLRSVGLAAALALGATGCNQSDFGKPGDDAGAEGGAEGGAPGDGARDPDDDVGCEKDSECGNGEICLDSVCQMQRCHNGPFLSTPPLEAGLKFFRDLEFVVADGVSSEGKYYVDGYAPEPGSIEYPGSWEMGDVAIADVAGGDFFGTGPDAFVVGFQGETQLKVGGVEDPVTLDITFPPYAIAAGDVDRDKKDEVVVLGQFGNVALCQVDEGTCSTALVENGQGEDVTVGDIDGDGYEEPVLLLSQGGTRLIYVWAVDNEFTDNEDFFSNAGHTLMRLDAGDLNGDGTAELIGLEDDGLISGARLYTYAAAEGAISEIDARDIDNSSRDVSVADIDMDERDEVLVLREGSTVELLRASESSMSLNPVLTHQLQVSNDALRISASDFDGDSPRTSLVSEEPQLLPGPVMPIMVTHFPPYDAERSNGESTIFVGQSDLMLETLTDSVAINAGFDIGLGGSLFGLFEAGVGARVYGEVSKSKSVTLEYNVGDRIFAEPEPSLQGFDYGLVVLSCACFHSYTYKVSDPAARLGEGGDGEEFVMLLPVGGTTTVWSSKRYNAMAEAVEGLPIVEIPYVLGDVSSYATGPQRANGRPIEDEDFVFPEVPNYLVSDSSRVGWWMSRSEIESNETSVTTGVELSAKLGLGPLKFGSSAGASWSHSHSVGLGDAAIFGGNVPPITDDPETPEDEYLENAYSFSPYVYREHYKDADGDDAAYYVMSFAVAQE